MYYANEDVDRLEAMLKVPGGEAYVKRAALAIGDMLVKNPSLYKTFGVYWWAMKTALKKYYPKAAWFKGKYLDGLMLERTWHGSLFRTVLAATCYHDQHSIVSSAHDWTDSTGEDQQYTLMDEDAGF